MPDNTPEVSVEPTRERKAFETIQHSIRQARIPGNDWKRELALIENVCAEALASQTPPATQLSATVGEVEPWTAADMQTFPRHKFDRYDRPRTCERCDYVEHDGSGHGWHPCSVKSATLHTPPPVATATVGSTTLHDRAVAKAAEEGRWCASQLGKTK